MKLEALSVKNFRSIRDAKKIELGDLTVLVGPNNEGKSNMLRALALAMTTLRRYGIGIYRPPTNKLSGSAQLRLLPRDYDWATDYPKDLQERTPNGSTHVDLWFKFDDDELQAFRTQLGSQLNSSLCIRVAIGANRLAVISVRMRGPGNEIFNSKSKEIAGFIGRRIRVEYVEAVRTSKSAHQATQRLIRQELASLGERPDVAKALQALQAAMRPSIERISRDLHVALVDFLPEVSSVQLDLGVENILRGIGSEMSIRVDDGVSTDLVNKGDGVQSLAAIAMARRAAGDLRQGALFLAIEEPEAHLHPDAIHRLRRVLLQIAERQQVVLTTHSPLLVNRMNPAGNILVRSSVASPARTLADVRDALGVRVGDNLRSAELVLLVEGASDVRAISSVLSSCSPEMRDAMENGRLNVEGMGSASNLLSRLQHLQSQVCLTHALLDYDAAGKQAAQRALDVGVIDSGDLTYCRRAGRAESEFEDLVEKSIYRDQLLSELGIDVGGAGFAGHAKWSVRLAQASEAQGKHLDKRVTIRAKQIVSELVAEHGFSSLKPVAGPIVDGLTARLTAQLSA